MESSKKRCCCCPCVANAEKYSFYIGVFNFLISGLFLLGSTAGSDYSLSIMTSLFPPQDPFFTPVFIEIVGLKVLSVASLIALLASALLVAGVQRKKSCGVKAFFFHGLATLAVCIGFTVYCILSAFVQTDFVRIIPQIIFIFLYVTTSIPRETTLNAYLRYHLALPGTKAMCHEGGCGACVVTVRARRHTSGAVETFSVNSCLVLVLSCHGWEITTIEGLGNRRDGYSDIQKRVAGFNATQCGYCTPGWVMHLNSLKDKNLTMAQLERSIGSNTCRCTGFRPILDTVKSFAVDASPELCQKVRDIEELNLCCKTRTNDRKSSTKSFDSDWSVVEEKTSHLKIDKMISVNFETNYYFFKVYEEKEIFQIWNDQGIDSYMLIDGNTSKGIYETFEYPRVLIDISDVKSLKTYELGQNLVLGANVSIEDCIKIFHDVSKSNNDEFGYLVELANHFELIAHIPVRKIGSLVGNLMLKHARPSFQSDVFLLFAAVGAMVTVVSINGTEKCLTMEQFLEFGMRGVLMTNIELPPLSSSHLFKSYKIMPRHQNALAIVNAAFVLNVQGNTIKDASIVYGNISSDFIHATKTETYLKGNNIFNNSILQRALEILNEEVDPVDEPPEPSPDCRRKIAVGLFYKFILNIIPQGFTSSRLRSGGEPLLRPLSRGVQDYQTDPSLYPLNQPVPKYEAMIQTSGEAQYANDIPPLPREVFGAFVLSTVHSGKLDHVDADEVLQIEGVISVYTAKDIPGKNSFAFPGIQLQTEDEEILASNDIKFYGQPIAIVVAESEYLAAHVAKKVRVTYKDVPNTPPVLTIDQAKKESKRYAPSDNSIEPKGKGNNVTEVIKGVYEIGAQYHYYMEPITSVVKPVDKGLEVYDSSQWMDLTQIAIAQCLGINESQVLVKVRRIGGGFGGKISRNVQATTAGAIVATKLDRPCRFILPLQTNLTIAGRRLPCQCDYEVGVDDNGKIQYLNATIIEDDGYSHNENILEYTVGGFPNCYDTNYFTLKTASVLTDLPSNTFARAPGTSEGIACIEHIMEHISFAVKRDATEVRLNNMRTEDNDLPRLIEELKKDADYENRARAVEQFNMANRWKKKAIKIGVMSFPVIFYGNYSAMVSIYRGDGTVTVTTGGIEMGQGVNTKAAQICAYELGIPLEHVTVLPNYSFVAANNVFSGSSIVSESVCYSIIKACGTLKERLEPIRQSLSNPTWKELIFKAGEEEVDLTATYMMTDKEEELEGYSAFAVVILEVELDVLTGDYEILRVDLLEDVGLSANPNVDVGQVEGAFVQGLGYFTTEKLVYDMSTGKLLTNRSLNYHVPLALDIPADFRVKLRYNSRNSKGVLGSKAVGEMGICTANVITHALRHCITESRKDSKYDPTEWINIDVPYDKESILKALNVKLEEMVLT